MHASSKEMVMWKEYVEIHGFLGGWGVDTVFISVA